MRARRSFPSGRPRFLSRIGPSPGVIVAALALVFALAGVAVGAKTTDRDEVTVVTTTGSASAHGPVEHEPGDVSETEIQLTPIDSYTQRAGESVLLNGTIDVQNISPYEQAPCDVFVRVFSGESGGDEGRAGLIMAYLFERGEVGDAADSEGLPAPAVDTTRTLKAEVMVDPFDEHQGGDFGDCDPSDTYNVSVRVSIVTLRN